MHGIHKVQKPSAQQKCEDQYSTFKQYILYYIQEKYLYNGRENKTVIYNLPDIVED